MSSSTYLGAYRFSEAKSGKETAEKPLKTPTKIKNAAIILSGSGVYDGSEITEAVSFLIALSARKIKFQCFAPNKNQTDVINHLNGEPLKESRNIMVEAARIARGKVQDLSSLKHTEYDLVCLPGGFGAAKNLSNLATAGSSFNVDSEVERVLREFHANKKPIALACIAPMIAARIFGNKDKPIQITLGSKGDQWPYAGNIDLAESLGCKHVVKSSTHFAADTKNLIFTAPAFMKETNDFSEIYTSINNLVGGVESTLKSLKAKEQEATEAKKEKKKEKAEKKKAKKDEK